MALDFPSSPTNGQVFGNYTYDSTAGAWRSSALYSMGLPAGGTANQFLTKIDSTNYNTQWSTTLGVANGGTGVDTGTGMFPIIPTSPSSGATVGADGLVTFTATNGWQVLCFSSAYSRYRIIVDVSSVTAADYMYWRGVNAAGTPITASNYYTGSVYQQSGTVAAYDNGNTALSYSRVGYMPSDDSHLLIMDIINPFQTRKTKAIFQSTYGATGMTNLQGGAIYNATTSFSGIRFAPLSGGNQTGTMRVFGVV